jgi:hypothetical protein
MERSIGFKQALGSFGETHRGYCEGIKAVAKLDPRLAPAYSIVQAAHYLKIPAPTVRSWVLGRDYPRQSGKGRFKPVVVTPVDPDHRKR